MYDYVDVATDSAIQTLLWSETDEDGNPLDEAYGSGDVDYEDRSKLHTYIADFLSDGQVAAIVKGYDITAQQLGHDFVLTANGHGVGFSSRDRYSFVDGEYLADQCKPFGELTMYVGDDDLVHIYL